MKLTIIYLLALLLFFIFCIVDMSFSKEVEKCDTIIQKESIVIFDYYFVTLNSGKIKTDQVLYFAYSVGDEVCFTEVIGGISGIELNKYM